MNRLRQAVRKLLQTPGFSLLSVLTLGVGIAASTTIFGVVDAVLLRPLPYPDADRLVVPSHTAPGLKLDSLGQSDATYLRYREHNRVFDGVALFDDGAAASLTGSGTPERLPSAEVTASLFPVLGIPPALGRAFEDADERPGAPPVVVLSDRLWHRRFGAERAILGRTIELDGELREVVGVMPPGFDFPAAGTELWLPMTLDPAATELGAFGTRAVARLRDGVTAAAAEADLNRLIADLEEVFPDQQAAPVLARAGFAARVRTLRDEVVGDVEARLWILFGTVAFVLLIACANVANLFLVRSEGRRRESAVRTALGATRGELFKSAFAESLTLAALAAAVALAAAGAGIRALVLFGPEDLPRLDEVALDGRTVLFTAAVALACGLAFGLIQALRSAGLRGDLGAVLRDGGRPATAGRRHLLGRHLLVGAQVALALVLLVGSGLMVRSFWNLAAVEPGFRPEGVITFRLSLPESDYPGEESVARFFLELSERLESLPGVESAGAISSLPLGGSLRASGHHFKDLPLEKGTPPPIFLRTSVAPGTLETLGVPLREGRYPDRGDVERRTNAVLVNDSLARRTWPGESAVGKRIYPGRPTEDEERRDPWFVIAGVVGDVHARSLAQEADDVVYYPLLAKEDPDLHLHDWYSRQMTVVVRTPGEPSALLASLRDEVWSLDSRLPIAEVRTLEQLVRRARAPMAFTVVLLLIASAVALLLGAVGTFGVVSHLVGQRTAEIGVRMALGARRGQVMGAVLGQGLLLAAAGAAAGLAGAFALTRALESILFEVSPLDPLTFAAVPAVLIAVSLAATWMPARRASRIDPVVALRHE